MKDDDLAELENLKAKTIEVEQNDIALTSKRFLMLGLVCLNCFGSYYSYDSPTALEKNIEEVKTK